jgi:preprotein translocase subunit SecE
MIKKYYKKIESYVQEVVIELKNVTWPTWNDLKSLLFSLE